MQDKVTALVAGTITLACCVAMLAPTEASVLDQTPPRPFPGRPHTAERFYPETAQFCRERGTVRLELAIDEHGRVTGSRVVYASGHRDLDLAAQAAVRTWQYLPATVGNKPVKAGWLVNVLFRMDEPASLEDTAISWGCRLAEIVTGR
jgi:TonB family protein